MTRYHESVETSGLHYIAFVVGEVAAALVGGRAIDKVWTLMKARASGEVSPEYRVPLMMPGVFFVPIGLFWYGWAANAKSFWLLPDVGIAFLGFGLM